MNDFVQVNNRVSFYDPEMIKNLRSEGSIVDLWKHVGERHSRQFFQYKVPELSYQGHISTPTEKLLTWQPMAITITFFALIASIAVWIIQ